MIVLGVDLSLTATGLARVDWPDGVARLAHIDMATVGSKPSGSSIEARSGRLVRLVDGCLEFMVPGGLVVMESPAYSRQAGARHERSGLWWSVARASLDMGCRVVEVSPTARARYATGKGNASKREVVDAIEARYGVRVANDNEADAVALAAIGARLIGFPVERDAEPWMSDVIASVRGSL